MPLGIGRNQPPKPGGENQPPSGGSGGGVENERLNKLMEQLRARLGDPYSFTNHKYAPKGSGVSCSGLFYSARQDAGLGNKVWGTHGYASMLEVSNAERWQAGKDYPAGTFFVRLDIPASIPTHMAMSVGGGKVIEALSNGGVQITSSPGWNLKSGSTLAGPSPDIGTSTNQTFGEAVGDAGEAVADKALDIAQGVAEGIAQGFLRLVKYIYGKVILQPIDFFSGFWWEFLKHFVMQYGADGWGGKAGADEDPEDPDDGAPDGEDHGDPNLGRKVADQKLFSRRP